MTPFFKRIHKKVCKTSRRRSYKKPEWDIYVGVHGIVTQVSWKATDPFNVYGYVKGVCTYWIERIAKPLNGALAYKLTRLDEALKTFYGASVKMLMNHAEGVQILNDKRSDSKYPKQL